MEFSIRNTFASACLSFTEILNSQVVTYNTVVVPEKSLSLSPSQIFQQPNY